MRRKLKQEVRLSDLSEAAEIRFPRRETPMTFVQDKEKKKKSADDAENRDLLRKWAKDPDWAAARRNEPTAAATKGFCATL